MISRQLLMLSLLTGYAVSRVCAFDEIYVFDKHVVNPWLSTKREEKIATIKKKKEHTGATLKSELYGNIEGYPTTNWKYPDLEKFKPLKVAPDPSLSFRGVYYYQKPGLNKRGEPYPRYTLTDDSSPAEIAAEVNRRDVYIKKLDKKVGTLDKEIKYLESSLLSRWIADKLGNSPYVHAKKHRG